MVANLLNPGDIYIKVSGIVHIANLQIIEFKIPFQQRINIDQYIRQFVVNIIQQVPPPAPNANGDCVSPNNPNNYTPIKCTRVEHCGSIGQCEGDLGDNFPIWGCSPCNNPSRCSCT